MKKFYKRITIISTILAVSFTSNLYSFAVKNKPKNVVKSSQVQNVAKTKTENTTISKKNTLSAEKNTEKSTSKKETENKVQTKKASTNTVETSNKKNTTSSSTETEKNTKTAQKSKQSAVKTSAPVVSQKTEIKNVDTEKNQNSTPNDNSIENKTTSNDDKNKLEIAIDDKDSADGFQSIQSNTQDKEDDCLYIKIVGIVFISLGAIGFLLSLYKLITKRKNNTKKSVKTQSSKKERYKGAHFK